MTGSDKTYFLFEGEVLKSLEKLSDRDASHLMYSYAVRGVGNPELHKAFEKRLEAGIDKYDYPTMFNALYYLLFTESKNKALWQKAVNGTNSNPDILPIIYYRPFKAAKFYLNGLYKDAPLDKITEF
jgi:hypothetical protein